MPTYAGAVRRGEISDQRAGERQAGDGPDQAGEPGHLKAGDPPQHDLLRHHGDGVDHGTEQHEQYAGDVGVTGAGRDADDDRSGERHQSADHQHPGEALPQQESGEHADQDRGELDQHGGGAGIDVLLTGIQRDVVDAEPGDPDQRDQRPFAAGHLHPLLADHQSAQHHGRDDQPAEAQRAGRDVAGDEPDHHERRRPGHHGEGRREHDQPVRRASRASWTACSRSREWWSRDYYRSHEA